MDQIRFTIDSSGEYPAVRVLINSEDLITMLEKHEALFAKAEGYPGIAGGYMGLPSKVALPPSEHFLGRPESLYDYDGMTEILTCECGEPGCWPFLVKIELSDHLVTWSDFAQPHREGQWHYDGFGPFTFDRKQYESALQEASS
jgi:hypothetical protein